MTTLYEDLGVPQDASPEEIKAAHRRAAKQHHPDKGGDREAFERVQRALTVLSDPARRARYDETGDADVKPDNSLAILTELLVAAFDRAMSEGEYERRDIIARMKALLRSDVRQLASKRREHQQHRVVLAQVRKRLRFKGQGRDMISRTIDDRIASIDQTIIDMVAAQANIETAIERLADYGWDFEQVTPLHYTTGTKSDFMHGYR